MIAISQAARDRAVNREPQKFFNPSGRIIMDQLSSRFQYRNARHLVIFESANAYQKIATRSLTGQSQRNVRRFIVDISESSCLRTISLQISATSLFGFRAWEQFTTREMTGISFTSVSSRILADLLARSFARSFAGQLPSVSGVVARRAGSRLNHLLWRTTAPRHHLGPHDVQANRLTRKFRTLLRVFRSILFSFPLLVIPRHQLLPLSVNQERCTVAVFLMRNNFRSLCLCIGDFFRATSENSMISFCNNHKDRKINTWHNNISAIFYYIYIPSIIHLCLK